MFGGKNVRLVMLERVHIVEWSRVIHVLIHGLGDLSKDNFTWTIWFSNYACTIEKYIYAAQAPKNQRNFFFEKVDLNFFFTKIIGGGKRIFGIVCKLRSDTNHFNTLYYDTFYSE